MADTIEFVLNRKAVRLQAEKDQTLLWVLRTDFGLTGTKCGCGIGACGTCTVLMNHEAVRSCQIPLSDIKGKEILTIEGLAGDGQLHPLQQAFVNHNALQCGYCTPGMILVAYSLLLRNSVPSEADIIDGLEGNLCRCGSHKRIIQAIRSAAGHMREVSR
jgi:aerobic-type carbon monoxide dehydrogenase small subunit (CoxS/CutS family)